jgi:predicted kinase
LHAGNIVYWRGKLIPFDGVEFNEHFRWIDVLSDTGFLAMDLHALGHTELASAFINQYLEQTGDYRELGLLRWYMVYRALVRAKVSEMARQQQAADSPAAAEAVRERDEHVALAVKLIAPGQPRLWITFGLSGSGKSTAARALAMRCGAIQIRSDVERKRLLGYEQAFRPDPEQTAAMYSTSMHGQTYEQLGQLSRAVLEAGFSVVVDAAFLKREQRAAFSKLAGELQVPFHILACEAPVDILKARLDERRQAGDDASDAGVEVLEQQLASHDALDAEERAHIDDGSLNR